VEGFSELSRLLSLLKDLELDIQELNSLAEYFEKDEAFLRSISKEDPYVADTMVRGIGQRLHQYYHTFERAVEKVLAFTGELPVDDRSYHSQLLRKASFELDGIRPALISREAFEIIDELRRYRHAFRNLYRSSVKPDRLLKLVSDLRRNHSLVVSGLLRAISFYRSIIGGSHEIS